MAQRLENKVILVSGGTRGLGEAISRAIVSEGGNVVFGGRDEQSGTAIARSLGERARFVRQDVTVEDDWQAMCRLATEQFQHIDGLVNNAGMLIIESLEASTLESAQRIIATNQLAVLFGMKAVVGAMREGGGGSIVNIGSVAVRRGLPSLVSYSGTKAAVVGMSRAAAAELAADNIRVNVINPGPFETEMMEQSRREKGSVENARITPLGRLGDPREIAGTVVMLLSDESRFMTGAQIDVDGGSSL